MDSTIPSVEPLHAQPAALKVMNDQGLVSAEKLRLHTLELLESDIDLTVDFTGVESLDVGTLQVLLALELEQARKKLRLSITGVSSTLLRWFEYSGAEDLLHTTPAMERTTSEWN